MVDGVLILRLAGAAVFIPFAIDQLAHPDAWDGVPSWMKPYLPEWPKAFIRVHAVANLLLGLWLLSAATTRVAAGVATVWMASIALSMLLSGGGGWRIAVRDVGIMLAMLALFVAALIRRFRAWTT